MIELVDAGLVKCQIIRMDHALHRPDAGIGKEGFQGMDQDFSPHQQAVLLWHTMACPMAASSCDQNEGHRRSVLI